MNGADDINWWRFAALGVAASVAVVASAFVLAFLVSPLPVGVGAPIAAVVNLAFGCFLGCVVVKRELVVTRRARWLDPQPRRLPTYDDPAPDWYDRLGTVCCVLLVAATVVVTLALIWQAVR